MDRLAQVAVSTLTVGSLLALVALGYNLVFAATRIVNFAHGSMIVVAGYTCHALVREGGGFEWGIGPAAVATVLMAALAGALVERVAVRPLGRFDPGTNVAWIVTTFSAGVVAIELVRIAVDARPHPLPPLTGWGGFQVAGAAVTGPDALIVIVTLVLAVALDWSERRTRAGRAFRAVAQDGPAAALMGIDTRRVVTASFALSGALAAIGAVILAPKIFVKLDNGLLLGIQAFVAAVLGGLGSTRGALAGGYAIALTSATMRAIGPGAARFEQLAVFAVFLAVLVLRPGGLAASAEGERV